MPCNAASASEQVFGLTALAGDGCGVYSLQLVVAMHASVGAAEKAVSLQNGFVTQPLLGETAYEAAISAETAAQSERNVPGILETISHTRGLEASSSDEGRI